MQTLSDLTATLDNSYIRVALGIKLVGKPRYKIQINNVVYEHLALNDKNQATIVAKCPLLDPIKIVLTLYGKNYLEDSESALIIDYLDFDNFSIVPSWTQLASYTNDKNDNQPTSYLGYNGHWAFSLDQPFYRWKHQITGQGWLFEPAVINTK
jgi:hypothetical protein